TTWNITGSEADAKPCPAPKNSSTQREIGKSLTLKVDRWIEAYPSEGACFDVLGTESSVGL
ncbi:hypothetical protein, partial [Glaciibacter psychrotolerans]